MPYTPDTWANNDPTKPLNATRLTKLAGQYPQVMADLPGKIADSGDPIGAALSSTIESVVDSRVDASGVVWPSGAIAVWDFSEGAPPYRAKVGVGDFPLVDAGPGATTKSVDEGPFGTGVNVTNTSPRSYLSAGVHRALNIGSYSDQFTLISWHKRVNTGGSAFGGIWPEGGATPARQYSGWMDLALYGGDSKLCGHTSRTGGASPGIPYSRDYSASRRQIADNDLRFFAITYDGSQIISYIDGLADSYTAYTEPGAPNGQGLTYDKNSYKGPDNLGWVEGLNPTLAEYFIGVADPASSLGHMQGTVYGQVPFNRALSQAEIMSIHLQTLRGRALFKNDMFRPKSTGTPYSPGTKLAARLLSLSQARGSAAATNAATDQTWYSAFATGGRHCLVYDTAAASGNSTTPAAWWVDYAASVRTSRLTRITWLMNNSGSAPKVRLIVRIGTTWYATSQQFACANAHSISDWSTAEEFSFTYARTASLWRDLTLTPGSAMSLGAVRSADIPVGELSGYGMIADEGASASGVIRLTDFQVWA